MVVEREGVGRGGGGGMDDSGLPEEGTRRRTLGLAEELVISGASGRFPESGDLGEFGRKLFAGEDLVTEDARRWEPGLYGLPRRNGKLKSWADCDTAFFGIPPKQATYMDPQVRVLLEVAYETLVDAGVDLKELRGSDTGVFVGSSGSESMPALTRDPDLVSGYSMSGCASAMFANRLSFAFDLRGPSFNVDTACNSSLLALQLALDSIRQGHCSQALVCGSNAVLTPTNALQFLRLGVLSPDGASKSFDADGKGYAKSEGVGAVLLQPISKARRHYASYIHAKSSTDGHKDEGVHFPSGQRQAQLLRDVYRESGVDPLHVTYMEAHGTGTKAGDPQEANAIAEVFCPKNEPRDGPLLVGSVKSNMGHAEPASGIASVAKVVLAMQAASIPPNLHFKNPNPDIPSLTDGRLKVVTEPTPWAGGYVGINSFGFGGANTHVLLATAEDKDLDASSASQAYQPSDLPRLVCYAGRTEAGLKRLLSAVLEEASAEKRDGMAALLSHQAQAPLNSFPYRGFCLQGPKDKDQTELVQVAKLPAGGQQRKLFLVFTGMGAQWTGMGRDLLAALPAFRASIEASAEVLKGTDCRLMELLEPADGAEPFKGSPHNSMVGNIAIQVALVDVLREVGVEWDGVVGHSTGEIPCAYADGCLDRRQTLLLAYHRGRIISQANLEPGAMAAVGLSWDEVRVACKGTDVVPACHNAQDSVTISGPKAQVDAIVAHLDAQGTFARAVDSNGVAFHSPAVAAAKGQLRQAFRDVIPQPLKRSAKWISTSASPDQSFADECGAEYQLNSVLSPVRFHTAVTEAMPADAVTVEVGPHALLNGILRRSLPDATHIGLMSKRATDGVAHLLHSLGKLYSAGAECRVERLYPAPVYPLPASTPSLSPLIAQAWDRSQQWPVMSGPNAGLSDHAPNSQGQSVTVDCGNPDAPQDAYLLHHQIDGRAIYPFTGFPVLAWQTLCKAKALDPETTPVVFRDLRVYRPTLLSKPVRLAVNVLAEEGAFQVTDGDALVASGYLRLYPADDHDAQPNFVYRQLFPQPDQTAQNGQEILLSSEDIYKELRLRGYEYRREFQGLDGWASDGSLGSVRWSGRWVPFLDALLQASILAEDKSEWLRLPVRLRHLHIDPQRHRQAVQPVLKDQEAEKEPESEEEAKEEKEEKEEGWVSVRVGKEVSAVVGGGVELAGLVAESAQRRTHSPALLTEKFEWVAYEDDDCLAGRPDLRKLLQRQKTGLVQALSAMNPSSPRPSTKDSLEEKIRQGDWEAAQKAMRQDKFCQGVWEQRCAKVGLDLVTENLGGHERRCLAFGEDLDTVVAEAGALQHSHPLAVVSYVLGKTQARPEGESAPGIVEAEWDMDLEAPGPLPANAQPFHLILLNRALSSLADIPAALNQLQNFLLPGGFVIVHELNQDDGKGNVVHQILSLLAEKTGRDPPPALRSRQAWLGLFHEAGLVHVGHQTDPALPGTLYILRMPQHYSLETQSICVDDLTDFVWLEELQEALKGAENKERPIFLTSSVRDNGLVGMGNCFREEYLAWNPVRIVADLSLPKETQRLDLEDAELWAEIKRRDLLHNCWRNGRFGSMRPFILRQGHTADSIPTRHAHITNLHHGDLSSLAWVASANGSFSREEREDHQLVQVVYAPLNFRDIMLATGRLTKDAIPGSWGPGDCLLGAEFAGWVGEGPTRRRVMGTALNSSLATTLASPEWMFVDVPADWSLEEAATVPVAYGTALYALVVRGRLRQGETVLVHSGSGGVGQAAIAVALSFGCEVFTTVGTPEKRAFLRQRFPQLQDHHISDSRSTAFELDVMRGTKGKGVAVVLNSLSESKLHASVRCLARHGRFLEIGKFDLSQDSKLGLSVFLKNAEFHGILLDAVETREGWEQLWRLVLKGIADGWVRPLPMTIFPSGQVEDAFRYMAQGRHIGKVLVKIADSDADKPPLVKAIARTFCSPSQSFLVTGGLGGFGLELAFWLVQKGARKIVLSSRSGIRSGYQSRCVAGMRALGAEVLVSNRDVGQEHQCRELLKQCRGLGPLGGVFHLAMVLRDSLFENQSVKNFQEAAAAKYWGTRHLDALSRTDADLRWFVCFSSVTSGRGNYGQTNYGWANSAMERICEARAAEGLPGRAIQWGAIGDVGVVLANMGDNNTVVGGTLPQRMPSCLAILDEFLSFSHEPLPVLSSLVRADTGAKAGGEADGSLLDAVARIVGLSDLSSVQPDAPLADLGLDSLMGMEIKQAIERHSGLVLSIKEIQSLTLAKLSGLTQGSVPASADGDKDAGGPSADQLKAQMEKMFNLRLDLEDLTNPRPLVPLNDVGEGAPVFFVHTMEGVASPLKTLAALIKAPAYCLQCSESTPLGSLQEMAAHYLTVVREAFPGLGQTEPLRLVGYSYGACVALEMGLALEAAGCPSPQLVLLDSAPAYVAAYRRLYRHVYKLRPSEGLRESGAFQTELLVQLASRFADFAHADVAATVRAAESWEARVEATTALVLNAGLFTDAKAFRAFAWALRGRYVAADEYEVSGTLKGPATLVRSQDGVLRLPEDYGLADVVKGSLTLHTLPSDHEGLALQHAPATARLINDLLG